MTRRRFLFPTWLPVLLMAGTALSACPFEPAVSVDRQTDAGQEPEASTGPGCHGTCTPCADLTEEECSRAAGCAWASEAGCSGECWSCETLTGDDCAAQLGCSWEVSASCEGTCTPCSDFTREQACTAQRDCAWQPGFCSDGPGAIACQDLGTESDCHAQPGCSWISGRCNGGEVPCNNLGYAGCELASGCTWRGPVIGGHCEGSGSLGCPNISKQWLCDLTPGCSWDETPFCDGQAVPCADRTDEASCTLGCTWQPGACNGTCRACAEFQESAACAAQTGCRWAGSSQCTGTCRDCAGLDTETCVGQKGCMWADASGCAGSCQPCEIFGDQVSCLAQPGCRWE